MNCLIVDDEEMSRALIKKFVGQTKFLNLKGECSSAFDALEVLKKEDIDLVFLDVEMPGMSGLDLIESLTQVPHIILITSKEEYAVKAFEYNVDDYLVKPAEYSRFLKAVNKVVDLVEKEQAKDTDVEFEQEDIFIKSDLKYVQINFRDVIFVEAMADYVTLYLEDAKHIIHSTMKGIEKKLPSDIFARVHRSYLVNTKKIKTVENSMVVVEGGKRIPLGASYKKKFMQQLKVL